MIVTANDNMLPQAMDQVRTVLRIQRHIGPNKPENFALSTAEKTVEKFRQITSMTFLVMIVEAPSACWSAALASINIMLVSVTERTRESASAKPSGSPYWYHRRVSARSFGIDESRRTCWASGVAHRHRE